MNSEETNQPPPDEVTKTALDARGQVIEVLDQRPGQAGEGYETLPRKVRRLCAEARRAKRPGARDALEVWLLLLANYDRRHLRPFRSLSYEQIGEQLAISTSTAKRATDLLCELGLLAKKQGRYSGKAGEPKTSGNEYTPQPLPMTTAQAEIRLPELLPQIATATHPQSVVNVEKVEPPAQSTSQSKQPKTTPTTSQSTSQSKPQLVTSDQMTAANRSPVTSVVVRESLDSFSLEAKNAKRTTSTASPEQLGAIVATLTAKRLYSEPHLSNLRERYGVSTFNQLTREQASEIIDGVNNRGLGLALVEQANQARESQRQSIEAEHRRIEHDEHRREIAEQVATFGRELTNDERQAKVKATNTVRLSLPPSEQATYEALNAQARSAPTAAERLSQCLNLWREYAPKRNTGSATSTQIGAKL